MNLDKNQKILIGVICIFIFSIIGYYIYTTIQKLDYETIEYTSENTTASSSDNISEDDESEDNIIIHIAGHVKNPGIVSLKSGSRIVDAIEAAGGLLDTADLKNINLAYTLEDGQKIYIPSTEETELYSKDNIEYITSSNGDNIVSNNNNDKGDDYIMININKASQTDLEQLPGIGPSTALNIIEYRNENGKFNSIEDLKNVSGIGNAKFNNIKEYICI